MEQLMKKYALLGGVLAPAVYVFTVVLGALIRPGYSHIADAISELTAAGAPNRWLLNPLFIVYNLLVIAFAAGVYLEAGSDSRGRAQGSAAAATLAVTALLGLLMQFFFPQDPGGLPVTSAGSMHIVAAGLASLASMIAILLAVLWFRKRPDLRGYAAYSWVTLAAIFLSGGLTAGLTVSGSGVMGLSERITIGAFELWLFVIGLVLFRKAGGEVAAPALSGS
jgi:hypothetical membrane protein